MGGVVDGWICGKLILDETIYLPKWRLPKKSFFVFGYEKLNLKSTQHDMWEVADVNNNKVLGYKE